MRRRTPLLALIGAAQALPGEVHAAMNAVFVNSRRPGERENLARAFAQIAAGQMLPAPILDALAATLGGERNERIRIQVIDALAHASAYYPRSRDLLTAATQDAHPEVRSAATHGLRIIDTKQLYASRDPMSVALDRSLPVESRLKAMGPLKVNRRDAAWRAQVLSLARDDDSRMIVAALELFPYIDGMPDEDFDQRSLIPRLTAAMAHPDPQVRRAAFGTLGGSSSTIIATGAVRRIFGRNWRPARETPTRRLESSRWRRGFAAIPARRNGKPSWSGG